MYLMSVIYFQIFTPYATRQGWFQRSAQSVRPARAALHGVQGAPAQQGLEGGQKGQLHQVSLYTNTPAILMSLLLIGIVLRVVFPFPLFYY